MRDWFESETFAEEDGLDHVDFSSTSAGQVPAPRSSAPPSVSVVAQRFALTEDLLIETQLRCWQLAEQMTLEGAIRVTFSADALSDCQEIYTAAIELEGDPTATVHAMGADPYEALARALALVPTC